MFLDRQKDGSEVLSTKSGIIFNDYTSILIYSGLPHVHYCLILDWDRIYAQGNIRSKEDYMAEYICAEIPKLPKQGDRTQAAKLQRELHETVKTHNIHTCKQGRCKKPDRPNCNKRFHVIYLKIVSIIM